MALLWHFYLMKKLNPIIAYDLILYIDSLEPDFFPDHPVVYVMH